MQLSDSRGEEVAVTELAAQIGTWLQQGILNGDPLALVASVILVPLGAILGLGIL